MDQSALSHPPPLKQALPPPERPSLPLPPVRPHLALHTHHQVRPVQVLTSEGPQLYRGAPQGPGQAGDSVAALYDNGLEGWELVEGIAWRIR